jgi:hypothetical protein
VLVRVQLGVADAQRRHIVICVGTGDGVADRIRIDERKRDEVSGVDTASDTQRDGERDGERGSVDERVALAVDVRVAECVGYVGDAVQPALYGAPAAYSRARPGGRRSIVCARLRVFLCVAQGCGLAREASFKVRAERGNEEPRE